MFGPYAALQSTAANFLLLTPSQLLSLLQHDQLHTLNEYQVWQILSAYLKCHLLSQSVVLTEGQPVETLQENLLTQSIVKSLVEAVRYPLLSSQDLMRLHDEATIPQRLLNEALAFRLAHHEDLHHKSIAYGVG